MIVTRWQDYSGDKAVLDGEDRTFDDLKVSRFSDIGRNRPRLGVD